jgi:hypothetical protein
MQSIVKKRPRTELTESDHSHHILQEEEINDIQLIREMLLQEGMEDSQLILTPEKEEEYDDIDLDVDTMNELEFKASQMLTHQHHLSDSPLNSVPTPVNVEVTLPNPIYPMIPNALNWKKPVKSAFESFRKEPDKAEMQQQLEQVKFVDIDEAGTGIHESKVYTNGAGEFQENRGSDYYAEQELSARRPIERVAASTVYLCRNTKETWLKLRLRSSIKQSLWKTK